jgi:hypothetical protein
MPGMSEGPHAKTSAEKVDEHCFLFRVELGADPDFLVGVVAGVERDGLNSLDWFEVVGVPLCVRRLLGEAFRVGDEGLGLGEGLNVLHAFHVAFVRVAVRGSDGDCRRFDPGGSLDRRVNCRRVPQPRWVGA